MGRVLGWLAIRIARHLPRDVVYWTVVRAASHAVGRDYSGSNVPSVTVMEVLERWRIK